MLFGKFAEYRKVKALEINLQFAFGCLLVSLVILDLFAARAIARSGWFTQRQIIAQVLIVFLVPLFGAIFALVFLRSQRPQTQRFGGPNPDNQQNAADANHVDHFAP
jgi:lysylphosphatidylglycerol synthetase-like protein (DUF2156 family)